MADNVISIFIYTTPAGVVTPTTAGSFDLRVSPFAVAGIAGTHSSGGTWYFTGVDDTASYKLYDTAGGTEVTAFTGGGTNTRAFYDTSLGAYIKKDGTVTYTANQPMGGFVHTGLGAGASNGQSVRYEQVLKTTADFTKTAGTAYFQDTYPQMVWTGTYQAPTNLTDLVCKQYVDGVLGGAVGMVQNEYKVICDVDSANTNRYSKSTLELCNTYLAALTSISSFRGVMEIQPTNAANCAINADDGTSQWVSAGVDIYSQNKVRITRRGANASLTSDSRLTNLYLYDDNVVAARSYTNFIFNNCDFYFNATDVTFTGCTFQGVNRIKFGSGEDLTLSNCKGAIVWYSDNAGTVTISGTQPCDVAAFNVDDLGV